MMSVRGRRLIAAWEQGSLSIFSKYPGAFAFAPRLRLMLLVTQPAIRLSKRPSQPANGWGVQSALAFILFRTLVFGRSGASAATETYRFVIVNLVALTAGVGH